MSNVAILVQSSDDYAFCWPEWLYWFNRYWPNDLDWPVYFVSHEKKCEFPEVAPFGPEVTPVPVGKVDFSEQLIRGAEAVPCNHILYWQVDYWPDGMVWDSQFAELYGLFKREKMDQLRVSFRSQNPALALTATPLDVWGRPVWKLADDSAMLVNHQPAFWRKAALLKTLVSGETAYQHENNGTHRMKNTGFSAYQYILQWYCHGVSNGQYVDAYESMQGLKKCLDHQSS